MPEYIRANADGGTYFFTVVTYERQAFLTRGISRILLRNSIEWARHQYPFEINAWVLLPDHLHCIWTLPQNDHDFSKRWGMIKASFSKQAKGQLEITQYPSRSREKHHELTFWQRRFWEHRIRDEHDYVNHMNYVHYNPVKHGLVPAVIDWPHSTFHRYVKQDIDPKDWAIDTDAQENAIGFGE